MSRKPPQVRKDSPKFGHTISVLVRYNYTLQNIISVVLLSLRDFTEREIIVMLIILICCSATLCACSNHIKNYLFLLYLIIPKLIRIIPLFHQECDRRIIIFYSFSISVLSKGNGIFVYGICY